MRSKSEIEALVRRRIDELDSSQTGIGYTIRRVSGKKTIVEASWGTDNYADLVDIEAAKADLLANFDDTVRLAILRDITRVLEMVSKLDNKEDIGEIPYLDSQEQGALGGGICGFSKVDIERLDPQYVRENMAAIRQSLYQAFGYKDQLPTNGAEQWKEKVQEWERLKREGAPKSEILMCEKEMDIINHNDGKGRFGVNGIPRESLKHCCERWDEQIQEALKAEESREITGQDLGKETLMEQAASKEKKDAEQEFRLLLQGIEQVQGQDTAQAK